MQTDQPNHLQIERKHGGEEGPSEVTKIEYEELRVCGTKGQQGQWKLGKNVTSRAIRWAQFWKLPQPTLMAEN